MDAVAATAHEAGVIAAACAAVGLSRASFHRRQAAASRPAAPPPPRRKPARALAAEERGSILDLLRQDRFVDQAPPTTTPAASSVGGRPARAYNNRAAPLLSDFFLNSHCT